MGPEARTLLTIALAGGLALAAVVGAAVVLGAESFDEREARILGTAAVGLLAGGVLLAALATIEAQPRHPLGWAVALLAAGTFVALAVAIWWESGWQRNSERMGRAVLSAAALLLAAAIVGVLRRLLTLALPAVRVAFWAVVALTAGTAAFAVAAVWYPSVDEVGRQTERVDLVERVLLALFVAIVGSFLLVPLLERAVTLLGERRQRVDGGAA
jgi:hypothetical protein